MAALGSGGAAGVAAIDEVKALCGQIEAASGGPGVIQALGQAVRVVSNLMLVKGVVTPENAGDMMKTLSTALALMGEGEATPDALAAGIDAIGRLTDMNVVEMALEDAVEMVMDILQLNAGSAVVRGSAIHCLGNFAHSGRAVQVMAEQGCMDVIAATVAANPDDKNIAEVAQVTMRKVMDATRSSLAEIVSGSGGADALASVIAVNQLDDAMLSECIESIAHTDGGEDALWQVLGSTSGTTSMDVTTEALRVLNDAKPAAAGAVVTRAAPNATKAKGLVTSMAAAMSRGKELDLTDVRGKQQAVVVSTRTLEMLEEMDFDEGCAEAVADAGGVESLVQLMKQNSKDTAVAGRVVAVLSQMAGVPTAKGVAALSSKATASSVATCLKANISNPTFAAQCVKVLSVMASSKGVKEVGLDRDVMRTLRQVMEQHAGDITLTAAGGALLGAISAEFSDAPAEQMMQEMSTAVDVISAAAPFAEIHADTGEVYYFNKVTNETFWDRPVELDRLRMTMQTMADVRCAARVARARVCGLGRD
jgi:hypothetical protein